MIKKNIKNILTSILKGVILSLLYFEITKSNDTNPKNVFLFTLFYITMINGAYIVDIDPNVVTTAFITKTVFTLIDERIKKKQEKQ